MLTVERARELLIYEPETGALRWRQRWYDKPAGAIAGGAVNVQGYIQIGIDGKRYQSHRVIFLLVEGQWPECVVDHINKVRSDNRWANLRKATISQNTAHSKDSKRNKLGVRGVYHRETRYCATITSNRVTRHLGSFKTIEAASAAYRTAAKSAFGEFVGGLDRPRDDKD